MDTQPEREQAVKRAQRTGIKLFLTLPILSWALYDFANTIFSSNIVTIFFPFYLQEAVGENASMNQVASTFISYSNAAASFLLVIFTPLFGVLIDRTGRKKKIHRPVYDDLCFMHHFNGGFCRGFVSEGHIRASAILDPCRHHVCDRKVFLSFKLGVL